MAKIRGVKPDFWTDEKMVSLKIPTRLFFIGLWNFADDLGVFEWSPIQLKIKIFPADNFDTTSALRELVEKSCVHKFTHSGKDYGIVCNFLKHQRPDKRFLTTLIENEEEILREHIVNTTCTHSEHHDDIDSELKVNGIDSDSDSEGEVARPVELTPAQQMRDFVESIKNKDQLFLSLSEKISFEKNLNVEKVRAELTKFVNYWTEKNKSGTKEKWELEKTFEVQRRLTTWFSNMQGFQKFQSNTPKTVSV